MLLLKGTVQRMTQRAKHPVYVIRWIYVRTCPRAAVCERDHTRTDTLRLRVRSSSRANTNTNTDTGTNTSVAVSRRENCAATYLSRPLYLRFYVRLVFCVKFASAARCGIARLLARSPSRAYTFLPDSRRSSILDEADTSRGITAGEHPPRVPRVCLETRAARFSNIDSMGFGRGWFEFLISVLNVKCSFLISFCFFFF